MSGPTHVPILALLLVALTLVPIEAFGQERPCAGGSAPTLVLSSARDTRIMQTHRSMNDGAAGLVWLKRGPHVRGIVGFDLSCLNLQELDCAELGVSVYAGNPKGGDAVFSAHRLDEEWEEGNQAFNPMSFQPPEESGKSGPFILGPFPGTGRGTTWTCRVDTSLDESATHECAEDWDWQGTDDCGGQPCYEPIPSDDANFRTADQPELWWRVTNDVVSAGEQVSWLLKVKDETVKSGAVKFYTRDGAAFRAQHDPNNAAAHLALAPRIALYGDVLYTPTVQLAAPLVPVGAATVQLQVLDVGDSAAQPIQWRHTATGSSGTMELSGPSLWTATVALEPGENEFEFAVVDRCGTEGTTTFSVTRLVNDNCGNGIIDEFETCDDGNQNDGDCCSSACRAEPDDSPCDDGSLCTVNESCHQGACQAANLSPLSCGNTSLCYSTRRSRGSPRSDRVENVAVSDLIDDGTYDVKRGKAICLAATVQGEDAVEPQSHHLSYRIRSSGSESDETGPNRFRVTTSEEVLELETRGADSILVSAAMERNAAPAAPGEELADHYRCHRARLRSRPSALADAISVDDAFENRAYDVRRPTRLCLAATVGNSAPANPDLHFLCYDVRRARGESAHDRIVGQIMAADSFGEHAIDTRRESSLCVPATVEPLP